MLKVTHTCKLTQMMKTLLVLLFSATLATASPQPKDLLCDICIDVVTDLDNWLTSDQTEADIVHFVEQV